jgi:hypothetical protein
MAFGIPLYMRNRSAATGRFVSARPWKVDSRITLRWLREKQVFIVSSFDLSPNSMIRLRKLAHLFVFFGIPQQAGLFHALNGLPVSDGFLHQVPARSALRQLRGFR